MHVIEIENLTHDYQTGFWRKRSLRALDGLSLRVEAGEVFGFLGPNGAGKTTTFKILMRMLRPTAGEARILGRPLDDLRMRARIGYLPERPYFYQHLTARELLLYCGALCDLPRDRAASRATELLGQVGLSDSADRPIVGIGHNAFTQAYDQYDDSNGKYGSQRAVHSSWLGILSELGYPGLCLLILSVVLGLVTCRRARRLRGDEPALVSLREFGIALEISLVAIVVGGTFLIFQYTELLWHVVGLTIALQRLVNRAQEAAPQPVAAVPAPAVTHRAIAMRSA